MRGGALTAMSAALAASAAINAMNAALPNNNFFMTCFPGLTH
jgi:hypothetical protein